ncbi:MAG TPA: hypothetical protein VGI60_14610 [Chthoniobacterales bacterium]|jgi:hypothetical protein
MKENEKLVEARPHQVSSRFTGEDMLRIRAVHKTLALPLRVSDSEIVHQLTLVGLATFERKQQKTRKV